MRLLAWSIRFLLCSLLLLFSPSATAATTVKQDLTVTLDPGRHMVIGESLIVYPPHLKISFYLSQQASIDSISVNDEALPYEFTHGKVTVTAPTHAQELRLHVKYHLVYNDPLPSRFVSTEDPSYGVVGTITSAGAFLSGSAAWFPSPVDSTELTITVISPPSWEAVTVGKCLAREKDGGGSRSSWYIAQPVDEIPLSAGPYRAQFAASGPISIATYFGEDNQSLSGPYLNSTARYLDRYQSLFGPYPFPKFAIVENFFPTGYGFSSFTLLGRQVIKLPFIMTTSLPHEIAHSWWGNSVFVDYETGNWCEGLATYVADHYAEEEKSPDAARDFRRRILADYASLVAAGGDIPLRKFTSRVDASTRAVGYGKGAMLFHMLRKKMGDEHFYGALKELYRDRLFHETSWDDFTRFFGKSAGTDLSSFMDQWLERTGGPQFSVEKVSVKGNGAGGWEVAGIIRQAPPYYVIDLPVRLVTVKDIVQKVVKVEKKETPFTFTTRQKPLRVEADPEADLFRILSPEEIPPSINLIKGSESPVMVVTEGCRATSETIANFLQLMGHKQAPIVPEDALNDVSRHDLIFCGVPKTVSLVLPSEVRGDAAGFSINDTQFASPEHSLFTLIRHPYDTRHAASLFLPLSDDAAEKSIVKIPHYGKYGYVAFRSGTNVAKGNIPAPKDPTSVDLATYVYER